ncbi:MAG: FixH family protein [Paracoccaceae bacterium]
MREITGKHVLFFTVSAFAVIIAVNLTMAYKAVSTFPGLEVKNSYVASQSFDADRAAQQALGWTLTPAYDPAAKEMRLVFSDKTGLPVSVTDLSVLIGRTTSSAEDIRPAFTREAGAYTAKADLGIGKWMLQIEARAEDGTLFRQRIDLSVKG